MASVACPKCGAPHPDGHRRSARCSACHEPLGKCRYCTSFELRLLDCTHLYRTADERISDPDEVRNCPYFRSRLPAGGRRRISLALLRTSAASTVLLLALMYGGVTLVRRQARLLGGGRLKTTVDAPDYSMKDDGFDIQVVTFNPTKKPVRGVQVLISGRSLPSLTCQYVDPPECLVESTPRTVSAAIGDLPPAEHYAVRFHFTSRRLGRLSLAAHIASADTSRAATFPIETEVMP